MVRVNVVSPVFRAVLVVGAVMAIATGVTFAALQSQATLTDNTISSATADLQVNSTGEDFGATDTGFDFTGLVPGADYGAASDFQLRNNGDADLNVQVYAETVSATGTGVLDKSKVMVKFTNTSTAEPAEYSLAQLEAANRDVPGASSTFTDLFLEAPETDNFEIQVKLEEGAVSGTGPVSVNDFDLVFVGTNVEEL